jgi:hypothetical protein
MARTYYVYILASESRELYVGVTTTYTSGYGSIEVDLTRTVIAPDTKRSGSSTVKAPQMCSLGSDERSRSRAGAGEGGWS